MLAEIFSFNWKLQCGRIAEFVPFDWTTVPGPKKPRTGLPSGRQEGSQSLGL